MNELPLSADIGPGGQSVGQAAQFCLGVRKRKRPRAAVDWCGSALLSRWVDAAMHQQVAIASRAATRAS